MKKTLKILSIALLSLPTSYLVLSSTSCNMFAPQIAYSGDKQVSVRENNVFNASCNYSGFYSEDLEFDDNYWYIKIYDKDNPENARYLRNKDPERDNFATATYTDPIPNKSTESIDIKLTFKIHKTIKQDSPEANNKVYEIHIDWHLYHSSIIDEQVINLKPIGGPNEVEFNANFNQYSEPTNDFQADNTPIDQLKNNGINIIDGVYNAVGKQPAPDGDKYANANRINENLKNDFCYWTYLVYQNLKQMAIARLNNTTIYCKVDDRNFNINVSLKYNIDSQTFDYIELKCDGDGYVQIPHLFSISVGVQFNYCWGHESGYTIHDFSINKDITGPQLLGAYTMYNGDVREFQHVPQLNSLDPEIDPIPYTQNFLSLVPPTDEVNPNHKESFQIYDISGDINPIISSTFPQACIDSGYRAYDLIQPRSIAQEFSTGVSLLHSVFSNPGSTRDSFANCGLCIPSFYLSEVKYDPNNKENHYPLKDGVTEPLVIKKADLTSLGTEIDINENAVGKGKMFEDWREFGRMFLSEDYVAAFKEQEKYKENINKLYYGTCRDKSNNFIDPNPYIERRSEYFKSRDQYLRWIGDITFGSEVNYDKTRLGTLTYKQIVSQFAERNYDYTFSAIKYTSDMDEYTENNVLYNDATKESMARFSYGLNYMFGSTTYCFAPDEYDNVANLESIVQYKTTW